LFTLTRLHFHKLSIKLAISSVWHAKKDKGSPIPSISNGRQLIPVWGKSDHTWC